MRLRDRLGIAPATQRRLSRLMQVALVGMVGVGLWRRSPGIVVNAAVALAVTWLPGVLERDLAIPMDSGLTLWLTTAVFLHGLGTVGIPLLVDRSLYASVPGWDHLTHSFSASVVAGAGYATTRALDVHVDEIHLPRRFLVVFLLAFVLAFGVFWEVLEFAIGIGADALGTRPILTQYGLEDTMLDLLFDAVGGLVVAVWGAAYLGDLTGAIVARLEALEA